MHEQIVQCASVHLFSGVHLQCLIDFWLRNLSEFYLFSVVSTLTGSYTECMHVSGAIFTSSLSL